MLRPPDEPLVSIIITSHNYAPYLAEAIDSALEQNYPHREVIVIDDGSQDGSVSIIESYGDRIVPILKPQGGQCSCFNQAFPASKGRIVVFLDADDVLLPDAVTLHVNEFRTPGTVKSCGYMLVIDHAGQSTGHRIPALLSPSGDYREASLHRGIDIYQNSFTSGQAWSRDFLERVLPLPESDVIGADGYLTAVDRFFGRLAFIDQPVARYRRHDRNKGPIRQRFDTRFMKKRVIGKQRRISFALEWVTKLGYDVDEARFRKVRDWRLLVMQHVLFLLGETHGGAPIKDVPLIDMLHAPLASRRNGLPRAALMSLCLLLLRTLPKAQALEWSRYLLERTELPGPRLNRQHKVPG